MVSWSLGLLVHWSIGRSGLLVSCALGLIGLCGIAFGSTLGSVWVSRWDHVGVSLRIIAGSGWDLIGSTWEHVWDQLEGHFEITVGIPLGSVWEK